MTTKAQMKASAKYDRQNTKRISLKLNLNTDKDILEQFEECGNVQGYIKSLVRADLQKKGPC
jgi:hypothetical protein